ncbi:MAG: sulfotransferase [Bacteroidota bacterium]
MKISFLYGARFSTLWRLLRQQRFRVSLQSIPSLLLHTLMSGISSIVSWKEKGQSYPNDPLRPVFIVGHWRSGTTHLHNLMTIDGAYRAPTTFQAAFPHAFLRSEEWLAPLLDKVGPGTRLMDNMAMYMNSPQEEEIALAAMGAPSSYLAIHFPKDHATYQTFVSFKKADPKDLEEWKKTYRQYLRKLVAKYGMDVPLVLKSPANTARIALLLEMYPDSRFIHIHRHPYETIRSTMHLYDSWFKMASFQSLKDLKAGRDGFILDAYEEIHQLWMEESKAIPKENLLVLGFEEVKKNPLACLEKIYTFLGDARLDKEKLQAYLQGIRTYKQNSYQPLSVEMKKTINERMAFVFKTFGYEMESLTEMK